MEEEKRGINSEAEELVERFGLYNPQLDLSAYQWPTLELLPADIQRILAELQANDHEDGLPLLLDGNEEITTRGLYHTPNVLLAGTIASGKTQFVYNQLAIWLYRNHPAELKLIICRSKPVDYNAMAKVEKHFLAKLNSYGSAIAEGRQAAETIEALVIECNQRLELFKKAGVKNINDYNNRFIRREVNPEQGHRYMSNMVLIMDDLQTFLDEQTTNALIRLTQENLYTGIYLLAVTSQIMARSITPQLRANFSTRIGMKLMSQNESRKILDRVGAEKLNPPGELLYEKGERLTKGLQPFIDHNTIERICEFIGLQSGYPTAYLLPEIITDAANYLDFDLEDRDQLFKDAARLIVMHQQASTSLIQRKLKLGYNRAERIIDQLEAAGIVGPFEGSKAREVLYPDEYSLEIYLETLFDREPSFSPSLIDKSHRKEGEIKTTDTVMRTQTPTALTVNYTKPKELPTLKVQKTSPKNRLWIVIVVIIAVLWYWFSRG